MNSQVYCIPLEHGWNSCVEPQVERIKNHERYVKKRTPVPIDEVHFYKRPNDDAVERLKTNYKGMAKFRTPLDQERALKFVYTTTYNNAYEAPYLLPPKPPADLKYERRADPVSAPPRFYDPPMETVRPLKGTPGNDGQAGYHEWRQLVAGTSVPGFCRWPALERVPALSVIGYGAALPPIRRCRDDPHHEKERWDEIRALDRDNGLSYGYRKPLPGYGGQDFREDHLTPPIRRDLENEDTLAMGTTAQSHFKEYDKECYAGVPRERNVSGACKYCHGAEVNCVTCIPPPLDLYRNRLSL